MDFFAKALRLITNGYRLISQLNAAMEQDVAAIHHSLHVAVVFQSKKERVNYGQMRSKIMQRQFRLLYPWMAKDKSQQIAQLHLVRGVKRGIVDFGFIQRAKCLHVLRLDKALH